jgi:hypothetical protein
VRFDEFLPAAMDEARERSRGARGRRGLDVLGRLTASSSGLEVVEAPGVGSARLRQGAHGPVIEVDPAFVERYVREPESALALLGHEILHRVRGDLSRFVHMDAITWTLLGLALDMFVNAHLERLWFGGDGVPMEGRLYSPRSFPDLLLLPPRRLFRQLESRGVRGFLALGSEPFDGSGEVPPSVLAGAADALGDHLQSLGVVAPRLVAELYLHAWLDETGFAEFWLRFRDAMAREIPALAGTCPLLLGDHHRRGGGGGRSRDDPLLDHIVNGMLAVTGGDGRRLSVVDVQPAELAPDPGPVIAAIQRALDSDPASPVMRRRLTPERGIVGRPSRSEAFQLALGHIPPFWTAELEAEVEDDQRVQLYLDVSGSMDELLPFLYRLVPALDDHLGGVLRLFSNEVVETTVEAVREGLCETTGGTDFDCVVDDALARRCRRILVITDGYARLDDGLAGRARAEGLQVYVVLTGAPVHRDNPLSALARDTWEVELSPC